MTPYNDRQCELLIERARLGKRLREIAREMREICDHDWKLSQVAGDGYNCSKCGAWMPED